MSAHSRAPWTVTKRFQDKIDIHHAEPHKVGAASLVVARVTCRDSWADEQMANAYLISAAPDLLAALIAVVAVADRNTDEFAAARAAIAKAKGESA